MPSPSLELVPCPVCGSVESREVADAEEIRREVEALWAFHTARLRPGTPPERLADRVAFSQQPPVRVVECRGCGLVYRNPRERAFELRDTYAGEEPDENALEGLFRTQLGAYRAQAARLAAVSGKRSGSGLEVGSYVGGFLAAAAERGWRFEGLDINERAAAFARERGFTVAIGTLETFEPARTFDAVAIWNCFDQLPDPRLAAARARALLTPGGMLAIRVPNGAFYAALRPALRGVLAPAARALLAHNNLLTFPYRHGFTPSSLRRLLEAVELEVVSVHGDTLVPIADEWTRRWAALEERVVKRLLRGVGAERAPWIEMYARRRE
ncbi:MAG TPA: methyltransferase domain-containing protein [Gemmatimonadaceae bacterium]|nr:methyltransferase domain-containing protein [Gemmatimonadaceae bacterium]